MCGDAGAPATLSAPAGAGRRPPSLRRAAATDAPTAKAVVCAVSADPAVGLATWLPRAAAGAAGASAGAGAASARPPKCGPPAVFGPAPAADRLRGGAGDAAAPGDAADRPRAAAHDGAAEQPRADAGVANAADGRLVSLPPRAAASLADGAAVLLVLGGSEAAVSVFPAVVSATTLCSLSTVVTKPLTLAVGSVGLADADDGATVDDATGAAADATSIASASVVTSEASQSLGTGVVIAVVVGHADGGPHTAVVDVGGVAADDGGTAAVGVDGAAAVAVPAARS